MKKWLLIIVLFLGAIFSSESKASHIAGGDISYNCIGPNQYQITLNLFRDCAGIDASTSATINITSACGQNLTMTLNLTNPGGTEISQLCSASLANSTCNNGTLPGMQRYTYEGTVTLPSLCNSWIFTWEECCRNVAVVNLVNGGSQSTTVQAELFSANQACNNSPSFTSQPIPYVCANQPVVYNYGIYESDGDSMSYSLVEALGNGTPLTYTAGYTPSDPIPGLTLNTVTGVISFTPTTLGSYVVVLKIEEFNAAGQIIGTVFRDIQFVVQTCPNIVPAINAGQVTNVVGGATATAPYSLELCEGGTFTFTAVYTDANPTNALTLSTNLQAVLPGSIITTSGTNPLTAVITWTAGPNSAGSNNDFSVSIDDGACPIPAIQIYYYHLEIIDATSAGPDKKICGPQNATLNASGGNIFTWYDINNVLVPVGPNFSCNPCANPIVKPAASVDYIVESNLSSACHNRDTVHVDVVPDFNIDITTNITSACQFQSVQLFVDTAVAGNPPGNYGILWSPAMTLSDATAHNPISTNTSTGAKKYVVTVTGPGGCAKSDSIQYNITNFISPVVDAEATPMVSGATDICYGDSIKLNTVIAPTVPVSCNYELRLKDLGKNGWNGGNLKIYQDGVLITPISTFACADSLDIITLNFNYGATVTFQYTPGNNEWQNTYEFVAPNGQVINSGGPNIPSGFIFTGTVNCNGYFVPPNYFNYTYAWTPAATITAPTTRDPKSLATVTTRYYVTVTNNNGGCKGIDSVDVVVTPPSETLSLAFVVSNGIPGNDSTLVEGCSSGVLTLTRTGSVAGPLTIQVDKTGTSSNGFDYPSIPLSVAFAAGSATATINVSATSDGATEPLESLIFTTRRPVGLACLFPSVTKTIYIQDQIPIVAHASNDTTVGCNPVVPLTANPTGGTPPYSYSWNQSLGSNQSYSVSPTVTTTYTVTVTDACGTLMTTDNVVVTVNIVNPTAQESNDTTIFCNTSATINVTGVLGTPPFSYLWDSGLGTNQSHTIPLTGTGVYTYNVTVTDACLTGYATEKVVVTVVPDSTNYISITSVVRNGKIDNLNGQMAEPCGRIEVIFTRKNVTGLPAATYTFAISGTATNGTDYNLQNGVINFAAGSLTTSIMVQSIDDAIADHFESIIFTQNLEATDCFVVTPINLRILEIAPIDVFVNNGSLNCATTSAVLTATATGDMEPYIFTWNDGFVGATRTVNPSVTSTYMVVGRAACALGKDSAVSTVDVVQYVAMKVVPAVDKDTLYCRGLSVNLSSSVTDGQAPFKYAWRADTTLVGDAATSSAKPVGDSTIYKLTVTDNCNQKNETSVKVRVIYTPMTIQTGADPTVCNGQEATMTVTAMKGVPPYTYSWGSAGTGTNVKVMPENTTSYEVVAKDSCSESIFDSVKVNIARTEAAFEFKYASDTEVQFENTSSSDVVKSVWTIGDEVFTEMEPLYVYQDFVEKNVLLTVFNNVGCTDEYSATILPGYSLYIPNAFTPGEGDDLNSTFGAFGLGIVKYEMYIYDRWGFEVMHTTDITERWDGKFKGDLLPQDTYVYVISAQGARGEETKVTRKGTISIAK